MAIVTTDASASFANLQPLWHPKAPGFVLECGPDPISGWMAWQDHLRSRKEPARPPFSHKKSPALLWGWPKSWDRNSLKKAIRSPTTLAEIVIGEDSAAAPDLPGTLEILALAYSLPDLARELPAETWWQLLERLDALVSQVKLQRIGWPAEPHEVVRQQLLAGELPLALCYLFPEVRAMRALRDDARAAFSEVLVEVTDGQGLPDARLLPVLGPIFACWTRARWLGHRMNRGPWSPEAEGQYQWLIRHAIRLADKGGRFLLADVDTDVASAEDSDGCDWNKGLFRMAIDLASDRGDRAAASVALPRGIVRHKKSFKAGDLPRPSLNSEWAGITIMADGWKQSDTRLALSYVGRQMPMELSVAGEKLISGLWSFETSCDGKPVEPTGDWVQLCWERGKRFDLLELGQELTEGLRLERQILFGRDDRVLYLADAVISRDPSPRTIRHSFSLPLAHDAHWQPEADTRDGLLTGGNTRTAVLPLGLHEWRCDPRGGALQEYAGQLILSQEARGRALCCPLFIDLDRKRPKKQRTWRHLTIGENLEIVPRDVAVGFRAQSGKEQWLFYRSLGAAGNRTVLGQNIAGEFCAGRFLTTGELREWIEIEAV
jgi:hypothetical protein